MAERSLGNVVVAIKAVDEASSVMDKIKTNVGLLGSALSGMGGAVGSAGDVMQGFAAGGVAGAAISAIGEIVKGLQQSVKDAGASEQTFKDLGVAVDKSGTSWDSVEAGTKTALDAMSRITKYSDEDLAQALQKALTYGMSYDDAMAALGPTLDFAAAKQMDISSASEIVGKAFMGNTSLLKRYGIDMESAGGKTAKFADILAKLNQQFGGTAQKSAETYLGTQERLANRVGELSEKIGTYLLPALTGITEAFIPVVDKIGEGVDAFAQWVDAVGKMPEVQGTVKAVQEGLSGLFDVMQKNWDTMVRELSPAITELMGALGELWDALKPVFDAFGELWTALTGGTDNVDIFKTIIDGVVLEIRGVAEAIKLVAPYIKTFAEDLKTAADFIAPILTQIKGAITGFLDAVKDAFQAFYNWLVGASLWTDLWGQMLSIATNGVGQLLGALGTTFLDPIKTAFETAGTGMKTAWDTAWAAITAPSGLAGTFDEIKSNFLGLNHDIADAISGIANFFITKFGDIAPGLLPAFAAIQDANDAAAAIIKGDWQTAIDDIEAAFSKSWEAIQVNAQTIWDAMKTTSDTWIDAVQTKITDTLTTLNTDWDKSWNALTEILDIVLPAIVNTLTDNLVTPIGDKINGLVKTVQDGWTATWSGLSDTFTGLTSGIQNTVAAVWDPLSAYLQTAFSDWGTWADNALASIQAAIDNGIVNLSKSLTDFMGAVYKGWVDFGAAMNTYMGLVVDAITATVQGAAASVQGILDGMIGAARSAATTIGGILAGIAKSINDTVTAAGNAAGAGGNAIYDAFTGAWNSVATAATNFYNWLTGHSLWPDLMASLVNQTQAGMSEVQAIFEKGLSGVVLNAPTIPELTAAMNITATRAVGTSPTQAAPASNPLSSVTLPITINNQIDGATISRTVERRLIANRQLSAWRSA